MFPRGKSDHTIKECELIALFCMLHEWKFDAVKGPLHHFFKHEVKQKGDIIRGKVITKLARHFSIEITGVTFTRMGALNGVTWAHMIFSVSDWWQFIYFCTSKELTKKYFFDVDHEKMIPTDMSQNLLKDDEIMEIK